ncbi:MAG TPA: methyltransferase domain-containing protein [bacterium]|nr:methyltransferase domain-containing protein [bacterium]
MTGEANDMNSEAIKAAVQEYYAGRVRGQTCCAPAAESPGCCAAATEPSGCCAPDAGIEGADAREDIPSYGCGTPFDASLFHEGEVIVDLGSGPGRDALLAARAVGATGRVIGVDMTPEMLESATAAAGRSGITNVEFRLGDIEALPLAGGCADVVISNCVLSLVPDKRKAFAEALRILRPGGRLIVNDILTEEALPEAARDDLQAWAACVSGAITEGEYRSMLVDVGFVDVAITPNGEGVGVSTYSARVTARRPGQAE